MSSPNAKASNAKPSSARPSNAKAPSSEASSAPAPHDPGHPSMGNVHQGHEGGALVAAWIAVALMIVGFGLVVLALPVESARLPLLIVGGVLGLAGVVIGAAGGIMNNVE